MEMKRGRKSITLVVVTLLLICLRPLWSCAFAGNSAAVDLVIVLDNSGSMEKNDGQGYRYDAAAVMLNMCEVWDSRAAIITFSSKPKVMKANDSDVALPIDIALLDEYNAKNRWGSDNRSDYTKKLNDMAKKNDVEYATYLGTAIAKAVEILDSGKAGRGGNQPIILVLADGANDPKDAVNLENAVEACDRSDYKVYTVLLKGSGGDKLDNTSYNTFLGISARTGGRHFDLNDPARLPSIFSEIFADQIGSSLISQPSNAVMASDGTWSMDINVPNRSVVEANILVQKKDVNYPRLKDATGAEASINEKDLFYAETNNFWQYKIVRPKVPGVWKLTFGEAASKPDISINVLFNYNVDLIGRIDTTAPFKKSTPIRLTAQFLDGGQPSRDDLLYSQGIKARVYLIPKGGQVSQGITPFVEMEPVGDRFEKTVTVRDFGVDRSGEYEFVFHAEGDGLVRDSAPVACTVDNPAPVALPGMLPEAKLLIEDPNALAIGAPAEYTLDISAFIRDEDSDPLIPRFTCDDLGLIALDDADTRDTCVILRTIGKVGTTVIHVQAEDPEGASLPHPVDIPVTVTSIKETLTAAYKPVLTILTPPKENGFYAMGDVVSFRVNIQAAPLAAMNIADYAPLIRAYNAEGDRMTGQDVEIELTKAGATVWTGSLTLADNVPAYAIRAELCVGGGVVLGTDEKSLLLSDPAPFADPAQISLEAFIESVALLKQEDTGAWDVDLAALLKDENPNDKLTFSIAGGEGDAVRATLAQDGTILHVEPLKSGTQALTLTAADMAGQTASLTYQVTVISRHEVLIRQLLAYGLYVLLAAFALYILRQVTKPSFRGMQLSRLRDGNNYMESTMKATKRKLPLGQYADMTMLADVGLDKAQLMGIKLKPGRKCIYVLRGKSNLGGAAVTVGGVAFSKKNGKKLKLQVGRELRIENNKHAISWRLGMAPAKTSRGGKGRGPAKPTANGQPRRGTYSPNAR